MQLKTMKKGKGYCITCENDIASWAFSVAVSTKEIDIGIETNSKYKQQGLGIITQQYSRNITLRGV